MRSISVSASFLDCEEVDAVIVEGLGECNVGEGGSGFGGCFSGCFGGGFEDGFEVDVDVGGEEGGFAGDEDRC
jgi:hypothetical protein